MSISKSRVCNRAYLDIWSRTYDLRILSHSTCLPDTARRDERHASRGLLSEPNGSSTSDEVRIRLFL